MIERILMKKENALFFLLFIELLAMPLWLKFYIVSDFLCSSFSNASIKYSLVKIANRRVSINF